jgi:hypothetical protein
MLPSENCLSLDLSPPFAALAAPGHVVDPHGTKVKYYLGRCPTSLAEISEIMSVTHRTLAARAKALLAHHKLRNQCVLAALAAENKQPEENAEFASVKIGLIPSDLARPE